METGVLRDILHHWMRETSACVNTRDQDGAIIAASRAKYIIGVLKAR